MRNRAFAVYDAILGPGGSRGYGRALAKTASELSRVLGWGLSCKGQPALDRVIAKHAQVADAHCAGEPQEAWDRFLRFACQATGSLK